MDMTHCDNCLRDLREYELVDHECPICGADTREPQDDGPDDLGDWRAECREINAEQARKEL